jgi:hypothetical protein
VIKEERRQEPSEAETDGVEATGKSSDLLPRRPVGSRLQTVGDDLDARPRVKVVVLDGIGWRASIRVLQTNRRAREVSKVEGAEGGEDGAVLLVVGRSAVKWLNMSALE